MSVTAEKTDLILQKIKDLPPLPVAVQKLIEVMGQDTSSADDISQVLNSDQAMAGKVLKLVNSSFYGVSGEISTVSRAVVILGISAINNLATGMGVAKILAKAGGNDFQMKFWEHSITVAAAAETLARQVKFPDPEEAFITGLLHDIGHPVMWMALPDEFAAVTALGPEAMLEAEAEQLGMTHAKAGQKLLKHWKLPKSLISAVRFHHNRQVVTSGEDPLTSLVALADALAGVHSQVYERSSDDTAFMDLLKVVGLDPADTGDILTAMTGRIEETRLFLKIATDEDMGATAPPAQPAKQVVMICTDKMKVVWAQQLLTYFGHTLVPMKAFFAADETQRQADLVILDPSSVTLDQLKKLGPVLEAHADRIVLYGDTDDPQVAQALSGGFPRLPVAFSRADLAMAP